MDIFIQSQLLLAALNITTHILRPGGTFVAKIFRAKDVTFLFSQLRIFFPYVYCAKPSSSRNSSIEAFVVCKNYSPPDGYEPHMMNPLLTHEQCDFKWLEGINKIIVPFVVCGDFNIPDCDTSYSLDVSFPVFNLFYFCFIAFLYFLTCLRYFQYDANSSYEYHEPVQKPISPPYEEAMALSKNSDFHTSDVSVTIDHESPNEISLYKSKVLQACQVKTNTKTKATKQDQDKASGQASDKTSDKAFDDEVLTAELQSLFIPDDERPEDD